MMAERFTELSPEQHQQSKMGQTVKAISSGGIGASLVCLSGLSLVGAVILLVAVTPVLVLCSPVLVPALVTVCFIAGGFLFSGGCGVAALTVLAWAYNYVRGKHPMGADKLDRTMEGITNKAKQIKNKATGYGQHGQFVHIS